MGTMARESLLLPEHDTPGQMCEEVLVTRHTAQGGREQTKRGNVALSFEIVADTQQIESASTPMRTKNAQHDAPTTKRVVSAKKRAILHPPAGGVSTAFFRRSNATLRPSSAPTVPQEDAEDMRKWSKSVSQLRSLVNSIARPHPRNSRFKPDSLSQSSSVSSSHAQDANPSRAAAQTQHRPASALATTRSDDMHLQLKARSSSLRPQSAMSGAFSPSLTQPGGTKARTLLVQVCVFMRDLYLQMHTHTHTHTHTRTLTHRRGVRCRQRKHGHPRPR